MSIKIALAGNPNSGKTTLFNALTGSNQYVGNWAGVTVEKKEGKLKGREDVIITDLPGIYSLSPYTPEEIVARDYLTVERPDVILNIVDGTNLERNLYLTTQLMEIGIPVVIAINMMDVVKRRGDKINIEELSRKLGCKIVDISALKGDGTFDAAEVAVAAATAERPKHVHNFSGEVEHALAHIEEAAVHGMPEDRQRWYAVKIFERDMRVLDELQLSDELRAHIEKDITHVERELDDDAESIIINERYLYISSILKDCYKRRHANRLTASDRIDKVLTNRFLALPIFAVIMFLVYYISIGSVGAFTVEFMNDGLFGSFAETYPDTFMASWVSIPELLDKLFINAEGNMIIAPWLYSLIVDGIVGGVGAVLGFVPQLLILFVLLSILEDCGYMARIAFILDKLFRKFGLSGKSFIPMLVGTGCSVPGIMASRTIEQERDRRMTIMTTAFIPCSAKLPLIAMISGALFGGSPLIAVSAYFMGIAAVVISGIMLKKTKPFRGEASPFVMELPQYHAPVVKNIARTTWDRGWSFIKRAGSLIFVASIIIWTLNNFSFDGGFHFMEEGSAKDSVLAVIGNAVAWIFAPLGFGTWQTAVATVLGLVAKEEVVGALGALSVSNNTALFGAEFFAGSALAGFSFMMFNLLCAPCMGAMGAIRREMNSAKWTVAAIAYMCGFAYAVSLCTYQIGLWFTPAGGNIVGTTVAALIIAFIVFMLVRPNKNAKKEV